MTSSADLNARTATSGTAGLQFVLFHAFKGVDKERADLIDLSASSIGIHYPNAEIVLLTNEAGRSNPLHGSIRLEISDMDLDHLMTARVGAWRDFAARASREAILVFFDCDMIVIDRFDELLSDDNDLTFTVNRHNRHPINIGFFIAKLSNKPAIDRFFETYVEVTRSLSPKEQKWGGDQTAIQMIVDAPNRKLVSNIRRMVDGASVLFVPMRYYNNTPDRALLRFKLHRMDARILHFRGDRKPEMALYHRIYNSALYLSTKSLVKRIAGLVGTVFPTERPPRRGLPIQLI